MIALENYYISSEYILYYDEIEYEPEKQFYEEKNDYSFELFSRVLFNKDCFEDICEIKSKKTIGFYVFSKKN